MGAGEDERERFDSPRMKKFDPPYLCFHIPFVRDRRTEVWVGVSVSVSVSLYRVNRGGTNGEAVQKEMLDYSLSRGGCLHGRSGERERRTL